MDLKTNIDKNPYSNNCLAISNSETKSETELRRRSRSCSGKKVKKNQVNCDGYTQTSFSTPNFSILMGNNNKVFVGAKKDEARNVRNGNVYLPSDKVIDIIGYFNFSSIISHGLDDYLQGNMKGKLEGKSAYTYDTILSIFSWFIFVRNLTLAFVEDLQFRAFLGETERIRPERQLVMVITLWSIYIAIIFTVYCRAIKWKSFSWLTPFQLFRGQATLKSHGLNMDMIIKWYKYTISCWRIYLSIGTVRWIISTAFLVWLVVHRWNPSTFTNVLNIFWAVLLIIWSFFGSNVIYISYIYFNSLCFYFKARYEKVNADIEAIIATNTRMTSQERTLQLHHILVEHNELCLKIAEYNKFWAQYLMSTYFFLVAVICFTTFQAFFTTNVISIRAMMFLITLESAYLLTKLSISASNLSNTAHSSYGRLIRVTFDKYPVDLQIQLRMFIQRLSGPTIGFYCLDIFEITYTSYASIVAALGQNFLLIVDFVRSYAEVGKEYEDTDVSLLLFTESIFNSTLTAIGAISNGETNTDALEVYRNKTF